MTTALNSVFGSPVPMDVGLGSDTTIALTQNNSAAAGIFTIDCDADTVVISHLGFKVSSVTLNPGADYRISLQSVNNTGNYSGTVLGGGTPASNTFDPSGLTAWQWIQIDNAYTALRGDQVAVVVEHNKLDASNFMTVAYRNAAEGLAGAIPYTDLFDGSTHTKSARAPLFAWKNSDASIVGGNPNSNLNATSVFGSTTEVGMLFNVPTNFCSTFFVKGIRWCGLTPTTGTNVYQATLYSLAAGAIGGTTTAIQSTAAIDADVVSIAATGQEYFEVYFPTAPLATLTAGIWYAIGLSTTAASNMNLQQIQMAAASDFNAWPYRQATQFGTRAITFASPVATTTAFTATATSRPVLELILADLTAPVSAHYKPVIRMG